MLSALPSEVDRWVEFLTLAFMVFLVVMQKWDARKNAQLILDNKNESKANRELILENTSKTEETGNQVKEVSHKIEETNRQVTAVGNAVNGPLVTAFRDRYAALLKLAKVTGAQDDIKNAADSLAILEKRMQSIQDLAAAMKKLINRKVLLVEDNENDRDLFARDLSELGLEVTLAASAQQAVEKLREEAHGLCFLDLGLPDSGDPVKLVDDISSECPGMQIAIVTGGVHDPKLRELLRQRVVALLPKPVTKGQLEAILDGNPQIN